MLLYHMDGCGIRIHNISRHALIIRYLLLLLLLFSENHLLIAVIFINIYNVYNIIMFIDIENFERQLIFNSLIFKNSLINILKL